MSTKTYTLHFTGPGMLPLPQGRFFMIKSASAALDIVARRRDGQPTEFQNVGAGLKFNALETQRWYQLDVSSSVAQVVEIVISDEAQVDFSNTVSVAGTAQTEEMPSQAISTPAGGTLATGTQANIAANPARRRITISNWSQSGGSIYVRDQAGTSDAGIEIQPGMGFTLHTVAALRIVNNSGASASYTILEET